MTRYSLFIAIVVALSFSQMGMGRDPSQYDQEAIESERLKGDAHYSNQNPIRGVASGVKQATVDSTTSLLSDTAKETKEGAPVVGTLEGARKGTDGAVDNAVKGVFKVATLGYGEVDSYKKQEPEHGSDEYTKFSIAL